jgi:hypothetical protein
VRGRPEPRETPVSALRLPPSHNADNVSVLPPPAMVPSQASSPKALALALLAFLIPLPLPLPRSAPRTDLKVWTLLVSGFEQRGVRVVEAHPRCGERDLYGLYVRGRPEVVVCPRGDRSLTLRHEGWHLVQSLCLIGRSWLPAEALEARLTRADRRELQTLVSPERRQREEEARVMADLPPADYLAALDQACAGRLPLGAIRAPSERRSNQSPSPAEQQPSDRRP